MIKLANAQLWVHDQDEALDFYTKKLGMEVRSDVTLAEMGNFRWLTVGPAGQPDIAITLMSIPGPPVMDSETAERVAEAKGITFKQCSADFIKAQAAGWRNPKHKQQWINTLATYADPVIGDLPVGAVDTALVLQVAAILYLR